MSKYYRIEDICKVKGGKRIPQGETLQKERNNHPYIRILDMYQGRILNLNNEIQYARLSYWDKIKSYIVDKGDVILAIVGNTLGMVSIIGDTLDKANLTENCCKFSELDKDVLPLFLYYSLLSPLNQKQINVFKVGSSQPKLPIYNVNKLLVPKYNINIQKKIVGILSALDSKIELNNKINTELEDMAKTLYDYWFLQFEFPNEEGKPYKSSGGKLVWNEELKREIPEGWEVDKLGSITEFIKDGTHNPPKRIDSGIPLLTGTMFGNDFLQYDKATYISKEDYNKIHANYVPQKGDFVVTKIGTIGNINLLRANDLPIAIHCNSALIRFKKYINKEFAFYFLKSSIFQARLRALKGQSIQEFVNLEKISSILVEIPNQDLLHNFKKNIESLLMHKEILSIENQQLTQLRDFLLPLLMNGQVGFKK